MHKVSQPFGMTMVATVAIALVTLAGSARAAGGDSGDTSRAREAYARGTKAYAAKDYGNAARAFAEADAISPDAASLEAALEASMRADDVALGAELLSRTQGRAADAALQKTIEAARKRFAGKVGKILVDCKGASRCLVAIDGVGADGTKAIFVRAGAHAVVVERGDERLEKLVQVPADDVTVVGGPDVVKPAPAPSPPSREPALKPEREGIPPGWFYVGLGATTIAGTLTALSAIDMTRQHDRFVDAGCAPGATGPRASDCAQRSTDGQNAQTRTNILLGATAILGVATATFGVLTLSTGPSTTARLGVGPAQARLEITTP